MRRQEHQDADKAEERQRRRGVVVVGGGVGGGGGALIRRTQDKHVLVAKPSTRSEVPQRCASLSDEACCLLHRLAASECGVGLSESILRVQFSRASK